MKLLNFRVELDKDDCIYEPGEVVGGRVLVNLSAPKAVRGLKIKIEGDCSVHWTRNKSDRERDGRSISKTEHFMGYEKYINLTYYLVGSEHGDSNVELPFGQHSYPFSFQLPYEIPSSFEHIYGHVRYTVKAVIDRPWKFDHETTTQFTVVSQFDLNTKPTAAQGIHDEDTVNFCCFCCFKMGDMDVRITLPISGYVPGQNINAKVHFDNRSNVDIEKIKLLLQQVITFHAHTPRVDTETAENVLREEKLKGPFGKRNEVTMSILIPPVPPSNLEYCRLIDIEYKIKIILAVSGLHCDTNKTYPILIGTIPLNFVPSHVPTAPVLPEAAVPGVSSSPEAGYQPMPIYHPPMPQDSKLGFQNYTSGAGIMPPGGPMTGMPSTVPPPGPSTRQIGLVVPPESPPPSYEQCIAGPPV